MCASFSAKSKHAQVIRHVKYKMNKYVTMHIDIVINIEYKCKPYKTRIKLLHNLLS